MAFSGAAATEHGIVKSLSTVLLLPTAAFPTGSTIMESWSKLAVVAVVACNSQLASATSALAVALILQANTTRKRRREGGPDEAFKLPPGGLGGKREAG